MSGTPWTDDELRALVEALGEGLSYRQAGKRLGRSLASCKAVMNRCMKESDGIEV